VSITGYGREGNAADLVAFGDDAAVAGGLVAADGAGGPVFCADAVADPLTGLYAAAAALAVEGGALVSVPMAGVAAHALARGGALWSGPSAAEVVAIGPQRWAVRSVDGSQEPVRAPRAPRPGPVAAEPGRHTAAVLAELAA
jgi:crotonobetainyl-CoA:carnitine CoA-transferase CaiB-like acyl-CoA transferase